jgi:uncharacterized membrane protein YdbT with pleckstrin-like domain
MANQDNVLLPNEAIVYATQPHWIIFSSSFFLGIAALALLAYFQYHPFAFSNYWIINTFHHNPLAFSGYIVALFALTSVIQSLAIYITTRYTVTNRRIIIQVGVFRRRSIEILLERIESIKVIQPLLGRMVGYGSITIIGTGGSQDTFDLIANPQYFHLQVEQQMANLGTKQQ